MASAVQSSSDHCKMEHLLVVLTSAFQLRQKTYSTSNVTKLERSSCRNQLGQIENLLNKIHEYQLSGLRDQLVSQELIWTVNTTNCVSTFSVFSLCQVSSEQPHTPS